MAEVVTLTYIKVYHSPHSVLIENISPYYEYGATSPVYSVEDAKALILILQKYVRGV